MVVLEDIEYEALLQVLWRLERRWEPATPDAHVFHAYDPLPFGLFLEGLREAESLAEGRRFLDVGCGIGRNMALAHGCGWSVSGVDRHPPYIQAAEEFLPEANLWVQDAFELTSDQVNFDLIYMYRPMISEDDEERLEQHLTEVARPGVVFFFPLRGGVWVKE